MSNEEIFGIINHVNSLSFSEFELEIKDFKLRIKRAGVAIPIEPQQAVLNDVSTQKPVEILDDCPTVISPITGVYYQASAPGAKPFVSIGNAVTKGDTLCIIEAMKMMIEVKADCDGVVKDIKGVDSEPVSEGDVLFTLEGDSYE